MIDPEDLMIPGSPQIQNRIELSALGALGRTMAEIIELRLAELRSTPVLGAYDAIHLQQIHARIFQDLFPWAGQFGASELSSSLNKLFDKLARENRLKGLDPELWSKRSTEYFTEIVDIDPFVAGTDLATLEFFRELATENNMNLRSSNAMTEPAHQWLQLHLQGTQSNNIRRILMLAVDPYPSSSRQSRDLETRNALELVAPPDAFP